MIIKFENPEIKCSIGSLIVMGVIFHTAIALHGLYIRTINEKMAHYRTESKEQKKMLKKLSKKSRKNKD